jgi:hypothetical protein
LLHDISTAPPFTRYGEGAVTELGPRPSDAPVTESPHSAPRRSAPPRIAAERGVHGAALLAVAYGWVLVTPWRSTRPAPVVLGAPRP